MDKDIEILKELISWKGKSVEIRDYEIQAIENLIKRNKDLEEQRDSLLWQRNTIDIPAIEKLEEENIKLKILMRNPCDIPKEIAKETIEEKIEEINNEKLNYNEDEYYLENEIKGYAIDQLRDLQEKLLENKGV